MSSAQTLLKVTGKKPKPTPKPTPKPSKANATANATGVGNETNATAADGGDAADEGASKAKAGAEQQKPQEAEDGADE